MTAICTLSTINAFNDLKVFLYTLDLFSSAQSKPKVYLLCDTQTSQALSPHENFYSGTLIINTALDKYGEVNRKRMISQRGQAYKTLWEDFMMEKATVIAEALESEPNVFFFDSDICFMGPLPVVPDSAKIAVSQHMIKRIDEERYGKFNAGFLWTNDKNLPNMWRQASKNSRFYDQAALEDVVKSYTPEEVHEFPINNNYGWWRMYQGIESSDTLQKSWSIFRNEPVSTVGIRVNGSPLLSIHTHWAERTDLVTFHFNHWVYNLLVRLGKHPQAQNLKRFLTKTFPHLETK